MLLTQVGKRVQNKFYQKQLILNAIIKEMLVKPLEEINVEVLCKQIAISKVTFFNYFSSKEAVIEYFVYLWQYDVSYHIKKEKLIGLDAINYIFESISSNPSANHIMLSIISFFVKQKHFNPDSLTEEELFLYNREAYNEGTKDHDLYQMFSRALEELGFTGSKNDEYVHLLIIGFYGVPVKNTMLSQLSLQESYQSYVRHLFK